MKIITKIKNEIRFILSLLYFYSARNRARQLHQLTGRRYHVLAGRGLKYIIVDNTYIDRFNAGVKNKAHRITIEMLLKMSFYSTPCTGLTRKPNNYAKN